MRLSTLVNIGICLLCFGLCLYSYLDMQNGLTRLRIEVPKLARTLRQIQEENARLKYKIEEFENPERLLQLTQQKSFSHLQFPLIKEVVILKQGLAFAEPLNQKPQPAPSHAHIAIASRQP